MAGGLWKRIKTWGLTEIIQNYDLNKEFDNIRNNFIPQYMASYSQTISQSDIQTAPGAVGAEVLPAALSGDIENIRYQIAQIIGDTSGLWRAAPSLSLSQINTILSPGGLPANRIASGRISTTSNMPTHLVPGGASNQVTLKCTTTPFICYINGTKYTFSSDIVLSGLAQPPASANTFVINDTLADLSQKTQNFGAFMGDFGGVNANTFGSPLLLRDRDLIGTTCGANIAAIQTGTYAAYKYTHSAVTEYFIAAMKSATGGAAVKLNKAYRGYFLDSSDNHIPAIGLNNTETVTLMNLAWIYVTTTGALFASYTNPRYSSVQPVTSLAGDMWYDTVNQQWKQSNGSSFSLANATPVGVCITDGTNVVAARSFDWFRTYSNTSNLIPEWYSTSEFRTSRATNYINIYGTNLSYLNDYVRWTSSANLVAGLSLSASTSYFLYLSDIGTPWIDVKIPHKRNDLGGYYHPAQSWRCVGIIYYNAVPVFDQYAFCPLNSFNGDVLADSSVSFSKLRERQMILDDSASSTSTLATQVGGPDDMVFSKTLGAATSNNGTPINLQNGSDNLSCSIMTTGRPVVCDFISKITLPDMTGLAIIGFGTGASDTKCEASFGLFRDGTQVDLANCELDLTSAAGVSISLPLSSIRLRDLNPPPGLHVYTVQFCRSSGTSGTAVVSIQNIRLRVMQE